VLRLFDTPAWELTLKIAGLAGLVWAVLASSRRIRAWWVTRHVPDAAGLSPAERAALLSAVSARAGELLELPSGPAPLDLAPRFELVTGPRRARAEPTDPMRPDPAPDTMVSSVVEAFNGAEGQMLLVGEPGSGKTVSVLRLIDHLSTAARADDTAPVPLLLSLASWAEGQSIRDWVLEELCGRGPGSYRVANCVGVERMLDEGGGVLVLDGLDEVGQSRRHACVHQINAYLRQRPTDRMAITCRRIEYDDLMATGELVDRLRLFAAYEIQPLSYATVRSNIGTLAGRDDRWKALLAGPEAKPFPKVLDNPLMLTLAATAKLDPVGLSGEPNIDARFVLKAFLDHQLSGATFPEAGARRWLAWIARFLRPDPVNARTTFYLEDLTPAAGPRWLSIFGTFGIALIMAPPALVVAGQLGLLLWLNLGLERELSEDIGITVGVTVWVAGWVAGALLLTCDCRATRIRVRRPSGGELRDHLLLGLIVGLVLGMAWSAFFQYKTVTFGLKQLNLGPAVGLSVGLALAFDIGVVRSFRRSTALVETIATDDGLRFSRQSWLFVAGEYGVIGLVVATCLGLATALPPGTIMRLAAGMSGAGLVFGLNIGLDRYGGGYVVLQWRRRRELTRSGALPRDLVGFLAWASDRKVLRTVGGGYQFCHLTMRDLLAEPPGATIRAPESGDIILAEPPGATIRAPESGDIIDATAPST
jgi:hypothetical protein